MDTDKDIRDPQTYQIIGAAMTVHRELGAGFLEPVYQEALAVEFELLGIPFCREVTLHIEYKGHVLACSYKADFVCFESIIVELKALSALTSEHHSQVINYLKATKMSRALLVNFGASKLEYKRFAN